MIIICQTKGIHMVFSLLMVIGMAYNKSIMVMTIIRLISSIELYQRIRSISIRVIKMHAVTLSSLTEATPSHTEETSSAMATLHRYPVNSDSLCVCIEFRDSNALARAIHQWTLATYFKLIKQNYFKRKARNLVLLFHYYILWCIKNSWNYIISKFLVQYIALILFLLLD